MTAPRVRILLLNWNSASDTIECLESIFALDYEHFDVVLCDNASSDDSLARIRSWAATRLEAHATVRWGSRVPFVELTRTSAEAGGGGHEPTPLVVIQTGANLGFAGGNNVGLRYIRGRGDAEYVWLLNNDCVVAPSALRALVDRARATPNLGAVGATLLEHHAPDMVQDIAGGMCSRWHGMVSRIDHGKPASAPRPHPARLDFITGGCLLLPLPVLQQVGLLDERFFMYGEDLDWGARMRARGLTLAYAPNAEVWHKGSVVKSSRSPANEYYNVVSPLLLIWKHHPARLPVAVMYSIYRCMLPKIVRGQWSRLMVVLHAYRDAARQIFGGQQPAPAPYSARRPTRITPPPSEPGGTWQPDPRRAS
jgi:GT2 family glycosyltransferase